MHAAVVSLGEEALGVLQPLVTELQELMLEEEEEEEVLEEGEEGGEGAAGEGDEEAGEAADGESWTAARGWGGGETRRVT